MFFFCWCCFAKVIKNMCILLGNVKSLYSSGQTAGRRRTFTPVVLDSRNFYHVYSFIVRRAGGNFVYEIRSGVS